MGGAPTARSRRNKKGRGGPARPVQDTDFDPEIQRAAAMIEAQVADLMAGAGTDAEDVDFDFDRHWANKAEKARPRMVRVRGRVYTLPGSMPAGVMFMGMRRDLAQEGREVTGADALRLTMDMLTAALGQANVDLMVADGIEMNEFPDVLAYVMGNFDELGRLKSKDSPDPGEAAGGPSPATSGK